MSHGARESTQHHPSRGEASSHTGPSHADTGAGDDFAWFHITVIGGLLVNLAVLSRPTETPVPPRTCRGPGRRGHVPPAPPPRAAGHQPGPAPAGDPPATSGPSLLSRTMTCPQTPSPQRAAPTSQQQPEPRSDLGKTLTPRALRPGRGTHDVTYDTTEFLGQGRATCNLPVRVAPPRGRHTGQSTKSHRYRQAV